MNGDPEKGRREIISSQRTRRVPVRPKLSKNSLAFGLLVFREIHVLL